MSAGSGTLGKYQIIREIARSNDIVYEAYDPVMNRRVALKELNLPAGVSDKLKGERLSRFIREAKAAGSLAHTNIVTIYEVGQEGDRHFIAMEYLEGQSLKQRLDAEGFLPQDEAVRIICEVLDGLSFAHEHGIIHRDIKPDNIQLLPDQHVKITDFGIARLTFEPSLTMDGQVFGTPSYMSPEQVVGRDIDARTDIFSCGVVLYETISGRKPFAGDSVVSISHAIMHTDPPDPPHASFPVAQAIRKALDKSPELRYNSAKAMATALRESINSLRADPHLAAMPNSNPAVYQPNLPWGQPLDPYGPPQTTPYGTPVPPPQTQYGYSPQPYGTPFGQPYNPQHSHPFGTPSQQPYSPNFPPSPYPTGWIPPPRRPWISHQASDFLTKTIWVIIIGLMIVGMGFAALYALNIVSSRSSNKSAEQKSVDRILGSKSSASRDETIKKLKDLSPSLQSQDERNRVQKAIADQLTEKANDAASAKDYSAAYQFLLEAAQSDPSPERYAAAGDAARMQAGREIDINNRIEWYNASRGAFQSAYTTSSSSGSDSKYAKEFLDASVRQANELVSAHRIEEAVAVIKDTIEMIPLSAEERLEYDKMIEQMQRVG